MLAWHYTTGDRFESILTAGTLWPSDVMLERGERPVVWFSLNQRFEPTARKVAIGPHGGLVPIALSEMRTWPEGLIRLGCPPRTLLCGDRLRRAARIPREVWRSLEQVGREQGADPSDWFGCVGPVPVADLVVERMHGNGQWVAHRALAQAA